MPPVLLAGSLGVGLLAACSATPQEARAASAGSGDATVRVSYLPAPKALAEGVGVQDPVTGETLTPPVAGAVLLPADPAHPAVKNWRAPDGRLFLAKGRTRATCPTKGPDGRLEMGDCAVVPAPAGAATGSAP